VQLIPAMICAPVAEQGGDRYRRERVLLAGNLIQALAMGMTAVALLVEVPMVVHAWSRLQRPP